MVCHFIRSRHPASRPVTHNLDLSHFESQTIQSRSDPAFLEPPLSHHHKLLFQSFPSAGTHWEGKMPGKSPETIITYTDFPAELISTIPFWNLLTGEDCCEYSRIYILHNSSSVFSLHTITHTNLTCAEDSRAREKFYIQIPQSRIDELLFQEPTTKISAPNSK